ncbi:glycoside hydrolase family 97 N-terminal domain-containing protein [Spirosoma rhododendri]|uniref:glycoside hydrolase family 97 N-terminal domain-containing protein n=1 Tax=Spirosoma rhododendri TaxID=2728024 RepID=UPI0020C20571|nr:glycoside hydrolase family 97 N-terminal domain-containing protein [Spirosoma rhododendri]
MKRLILWLPLWLCGYVGQAQTPDPVVSSPDGKLVVTVSLETGKPTYSISLNGKPFLARSPLGLKTNVGDFSEGLAAGKPVAITKIDRSYELKTIKKSNVHYVANEGIFSYSKDNAPAIDITFRVSNNDVAFKYKVYPQKASRSCVVNEEKTGFVLPTGTTTFLSAQSKAMVGFARTMPSYEIPYTVDDTLGENGRSNGYTFPCLFNLNSNGWVLISEAGVDSRYCGSRLIGHADGLYTIGFPMPDENNGIGTSAPGIPLPGETPWRTITVGETLAPIVETTVPFDVVEPRYKGSQPYEYTKGSWSWIIGMDGRTVYDEQVRYIDFSAAMGYKTVLVDALWDTQIGRDKVAELARYAATKGVSLYLWYNSNGYWNDAPQGPRGIMDNTIARRKEMAWMKRIGVKGIKVDFFWRG